MYKVNVMTNDRLLNNLVICNPLTKQPRTYASEEYATQEIMETRYVCCMNGNQFVVVPQHSIFYITFERINDDVSST